MFSKRNLISALLKQSLKAAIAAGCAVAIVFVAHGQIAKISKSIAEKKSVTAVLERRSEIVGQLRQELARIGDNETKVENALPSVDAIPDVLAAFNGIGNETSLHFVVRLGEPVPYKTPQNLAISSVDYSGTLDGNIETLIRFMEAYERLPFLASITSISVSAPSQGWAANSQITIPGRVYIKESN